MATDRSTDPNVLAALTYHAEPKPGKLEVRATKPLANARDLARAYSPGVAEACLAIRDDPTAASRYTVRSNLVAVVSNGTAVLGLGDIGPLAAKPVMEGKAVLFKKFADIDCFDLEVDETDPERFAEIIAALEPTFGAVNLEDIRAPDCFVVERLCQAKMNIPVFHDDQHGTAIVVGAAATNALRVAKKRFEDLVVVSTGGGAAGIACLDMLLQLGVRRQNVYLYDRLGPVFRGRTDEMTPQKETYARPEGPIPLDEAIEGADMFLGLSGPEVLTPQQVARMAKPPIVFALANPTPEILPDEVRAVAPDALIATGRSDFPNQVNNVLCYPFIFRGALDVGATEVNEEMKVACVEAIAALARASSSAEAAAAYQGETLRFGPDYLIPKPFDPRLLAIVAGAVAEAAMRSGVASRPLEDVERYRTDLDHSVFRSAFIMRPVFEAARAHPRRIAFAEGEDERVLRAAFATREETGDRALLIGRPDVIAAQLERHAIPLRIGDDVEVVNPQGDRRYRAYWEAYHQVMCRRGVTPDLARAILRTNTTAIGAVMVRRGDADSVICGTFGQYLWHLKYVTEILGGPTCRPVGALSMMILEGGPVFVADTQVNPDPDPDQIVDTVVEAAHQVRRFGLTPKVALCCHSTFGSLQTHPAIKMRRAMEILDAVPRDFQYEGEMPVNVAVNPELRQRIFPHSRLEGRANLLVLATADAASSVRNALRGIAGALEVGPILMGMENKAHIVTPSITARGLLNIAALAGTTPAREL